VLRLFNLLITISFFINSSCASAQELFLLSRPASNIPAHSVSIGLGNSFISAPNSFIRIQPEVAYGVSGKLMLQWQGAITNRIDGLKFNGQSLYAQYKFLNIDEKKRHFRMAGFTRIGLGDKVQFQDELDVNGMNSGWEFGLISTQLLHKTAISGTVGMEKAYFENNNNTALSYSLSVGQLVLPKKYKSYKQTNINLMTELLGQSEFNEGKSFIDIAPVVQFIFLSRSRLDIAYRVQVLGNMQRVAKNGFIMRLEYNLYNVF
jgi:hypothetical protein